MEKVFKIYKYNMITFFKKKKTFSSSNSSNTNKISTEDFGFKIKKKKYILQSGHISSIIRTTKM